MAVKVGGCLSIYTEWGSSLEEGLLKDRRDRMRIQPLVEDNSRDWIKKSKMKKPGWMEIEKWDNSIKARFKGSRARPKSGQVRSGSLRSRFKPRVRMEGERGGGGGTERGVKYVGSAISFSLKLKMGGNQRWDEWVL